MTGKFIKVKCEKCKNEQMIFEKTATKIECLVCGTVLVETTGGSAVIKAKIIK